MPERWLRLDTATRARPRLGTAISAEFGVIRTILHDFTHFTGYAPPGGSKTINTALGRRFYRIRSADPKSNFLPRTVF